MATPQNSNNTKLGKTAEQNYSAVRSGNNDGSISFGHIHKDGATTSSVLLQSPDGRHHISLDKSGERIGCTQITGPKRLSIQHGEDMKESEDCIFINAKNGNLDIIASNGKIRLQGTDIELIAVGEGGSKGNVIIKANENINLDADNKVVINAKLGYNIVTPGTAEIAANSCMIIYSSIIRGVTDACSKKDSKVGGKRLVEKYNKT
jgi:hypothetical protein